MSSHISGAASQARKLRVLLECIRAYLPVRRRRSRLPTLDKVDDESAPFQLKHLLIFREQWLK